MRDLGRADLLGNIFAVEPDGAILPSEVNLADKVGQLFGVGQGDVGANRSQRRSPIERTGVQEFERELRCDLVRDTALARPGGAVDGDNQGEIILELTKWDRLLW